MTQPTLKRVLRLDSIPLDETYWTKEGYLIDHPVVTSTGIFEYTNPDGSIRRELRLPEEVFDPASLASYKGKPVILTHEAGVVDKKNVDREHIGTILSNGYQDGDNVRAEIVIHETDLMKRSGLRELSLGYSLDLDETPGVWNGQPYDAIQRNIRINHLALVDKARAGEKARLNIDGFTRKIKGGKKNMAKTKRNDGAPMSPEDLAASIKAYKERQAARAPGADGDDTTPATGSAPAADTASTASPAAPAAVGGEQKDGDDPVQMVKDRRDRRDSEGDPADMDKAMGVIAQQDEDICTCWIVIEGLQPSRTSTLRLGRGTRRLMGMIPPPRTVTATAPTATTRAPPSTPTPPTPSSAPALSWSGWATSSTWMASRPWASWRRRRPSSGPSTPPCAWTVRARPTSRRPSTWRKTP